MHAVSNHYRPLARRALVHMVKPGASGHTQVVGAFQTLRERLTRTLVPVFGPSAIDALFERSTSLASGEFGWLPGLSAAGPLARPGSVKVPTSESVDQCVEAFAALLGHDIGLLVALVGEDFILPLVDKAWGPVGVPPPARDLV